MTSPVTTILTDYPYAIRFKASDGGAMIVGRDGQPWSLTQKYLKPIAPDIVDKYDDWKPMEPEKHAAYYAMLLAMRSGEPVVAIDGRHVTVVSPISDEPAENASQPVSPVSEAAVKSAGQVAEALGTAISVFAATKPEAAERALKELLWIAKSVSWLTKENRHLFQSKWNPPDAQVSPQSQSPSDRESEGREGTE